ncbi:hypothetical protein AAEU32_08560 [Pseudoalteromonas sp. SSDWG2]|uniref:hypothetical protein n=1 Tax=Pseudoalteromonas sp. SSDWG2 TaxID=3139391 RepID=UPI003BA841E9
MNTTLAAMHHQGLIFSAKQPHNDSDQEAQQQPVSSGFAKLDQLLSGGWPQSGVINVQSDPAIGEFTLLQGTFTKAKEDTMVVLINPPAEPCIHWLLSQNVHPERVVILRPENDTHALWAAEQCTRSSSCALVWLWHQGLSFAQARRFNLACQQSGALLVLVNYQRQVSALPVHMSINVSQHEQQLKVTLLRQQGRFARGEVILERTQIWPFLQYSHRMQRSNVHAFSAFTHTPHYEVG